ncbi:MAG: hypothetical protein M3512_09180 [Bacteroidota bacterium]|nr:hypothetical protein [Bacteroidota bacterium]
MNQEGVTPEEVLRKFDTGHSTVKYTIAKQAIKFANERSETVYAFMIKSGSVMMFLLLPFVALLLKLFYIRRNKLYVEHMTFTLHIHSFLFFILFLVIVLYSFWPHEDILTYSIFIILIYFLLSFKNFYQQSWLKTIIKMFLLSIVYQVSVFIFFWATVTVSFFLY